jgi:hypothetical protein
MGQVNRALFILEQPADRERAAVRVFKAPLGSSIEVKDQPSRSVHDNAKMWALLTSLSKQLVWHGARYAPEDWRCYFVHAVKGERWMPAERGGMVPLVGSTTDLSVAEHRKLVAEIKAFAERQGIEL